MAVIPARFASTRFPGKLLAPLHGKSVLQHVHERARRIRGLDRLLVATDDERIAREVRTFGGEVLLTSRSHASGTDRIGEVVSRLHPTPGFVLNLQGDEPFLSASALERLLQALREKPDAVWTLAHPITDGDELTRPSVVKVVRAQDGRALYFSRASVPFEREAGSRVGRPLRHVGVYGFPTRLLSEFIAAPPSPLERTEGLEQLRALELGLTIRVLEAGWPDSSIDTPEDLERLLRRFPTPEAMAAATAD